jgi:hypothetical protein
MRVLPLLWVAALLQACALHEKRAYQITRPRPSDAAKVRHILRNVATQIGLPDSPRGGPGGVLAFHNGFNVLLRANVESNSIDIFLSRSDWPPPKAFETAGRLLPDALSTAFGTRFQIPKERLVGQISVQ